MVYEAEQSSETKRWKNNVYVALFNDYSMPDAQLRVSCHQHFVLVVHAWQHSEHSDLMCLDIQRHIGSNAPAVMARERWSQRVAMVVTGWISDNFGGAYPGNSAACQER